MSQVAYNIDHINNRFVDHNVGAMMGMPVAQYSGSYGENLFNTSSTHAPPVDNSMAVALSVAYTAMYCSS